MKTLQRILLAIAAVLLIAANAQATMFFARPYDPNLQRWITRDPLGEPGFEVIRQTAPWNDASRDEQPAELTQGPNLYTYVMNSPVNHVDPFGLEVGDWWDARTYANEGFAEGWSKGGQGVVNAFTGGLFWPEYGLFYDGFDKQWKDLGTGGTKDDSAFKFGNNGGRVAVGCLTAAGGLQAAGIGSRIAAHGSHHTFGPFGRLPHAQLN